MTSDLTIRRISSIDLPACAGILFDAFGGIARQHNFPLDFPAPEMGQQLLGMFAGHPKVFGVVAERGGQVVGSNFLDERDAIAAVGPITVNPGEQSRGVGRRLMTAVIEQGQAAGHAGIRLVQDAFNTTSMSLYSSLGFDIKEPLALMMGRPKSTPPTGTDVQPVAASDIDACAALCRAVHGFDRANELRDAMQMFGPALLRRGGRVVAYASAPHFWFLNHGVAEREQDLRDLLLGAAAASGQPLALLLPTRRSEFFRWALGEGLRVIKPLSLMAMGEYREPSGAFYPSVGY